MVGWSAAVSSYYLENKFHHSTSLLSQDRLISLKYDTLTYKVYCSMKLTLQFLKVTFRDLNIFTKVKGNEIFNFYQILTFWHLAEPTLL